MVAELKALGGLHTLEDFAAQAESASYVTPISVPYRGVELVELPPSNHGIVALIMLKMLERLGKLPRGAGLGRALPRADGGGAASPTPCATPSSPTPTWPTCRSSTCWTTR